MTNREFYSAIVENTISAEVVAHAQEQLVKLDERNAKRNATAQEKRKETNAPLRKAILDFLGEHSAVLSVDLAKAMSEVFEDTISTSKITGVCGVLRKEGALVSTEVAVKGKGKQVAWSLADEG